MLDIRPFRGVRYDFRRIPLSAVLCPPYDVIPPALARRLRRRPYNAVHLELPAGGPGTRYRRAARAWSRWLGRGVLVEDDAPSIYATEQRYRLGGKSYRRTGLLAALGLSRASAARVVPHERTFPKPKEDRRRLLESLRASTSPVFTLYTDAGGAIRRRLARAVRAAPMAAGRSPDGVRVRVWRLEDSAVVAALRRAFRAKTLLVADGHHRLEVAKEFCRRTFPRAGSVLVYLCAEEDPGVVVLPTHRVLEDAARMELLRRECRLRRMKSPAALQRALKRAPPIAFGVTLAARGSPRLMYLAVPRRPGGIKSGLGVEWLQKRVLAGASPGGVAYTHEAREALDMARRRGGLALLVRPLRVDEIRRAVRRSGLLPQKSTYFYPKVGAGVVFKRLP